MKRWERAVSQGKPCALDFRLRRRDGVCRWFHGRAEPLLDNENRVVEWFAACGESDDSRRSEESRRPALIQELGPGQTLLEKALAIAQSYIDVFDIATRRNVYGNQEAKNYIGYSAEELTAMGSGLLAALGTERAKLTHSGAI